jgi:phosphoglycolate phosphatase-like HAD superfamily hydrolase
VRGSAAKLDYARISKDDWSDKLRLRAAFPCAVALMHATILDIDGTLLNSNDVDGELYIAAVRSVLRQVRIHEGWDSYAHVTDAGILNEILADNGIENDECTVASIKRVFVKSLQCHIEKCGPFTEVPGARQFVAGLCAASDQTCAYATGCWRASAEVKLRSAGFPINGVPLSTSDDRFDRCAILQYALQQLGNNFETVTYYGDGAWDREAANRLGWRFVPVGSVLNGIMSFKPNAT